MIAGLYVCQYSNGRIKVGRSLDVEARIRQHVRKNCKVIRSKMIPCNDDLIPRETILLKGCRELLDGSERHRGEWFDGLTFEQICDVAEKSLMIEIKPQVSVVTSVKLTPDAHHKFRFLMQCYGRAWLERIIDREHVKANKPKGKK